MDIFHLSTRHTYQSSLERACPWVQEVHSRLTETLYIMDLMGLRGSFLSAKEYSPEALRLVAFAAFGHTSLDASEKLMNLEEGNVNLTEATLTQLKYAVVCIFEDLFGCTLDVLEEDILEIHQILFSH
jgi:hypothetical protein